MNLNEHVESNMRTQGTTKLRVLTCIAADAGVSVQLLYTILAGKKLKNYNKAKAISAATGGQVTIGELCE